MMALDDAVPLAADPIEDAARHIGAMVQVIRTVDAARRDNLSTYPLLPRHELEDYWARRIIARLLDQGWTPPGTGDMQARFAKWYPGESDSAP